RIVRAARLPFEIGTLLDGQALMEDIALDMGLRLQRDAETPDRADHAAAHHHVFGDDAADDLRFVAEEERAAIDVALDLAVDLEFALGLHVAGDRQVFADDGRNQFARAWAFYEARRSLAERRVRLAFLAQFAK